MTDQNIPVAPPAQPYQPYPQQKSGTNVLAIVALVSAFFVSLVAVICGHIALSQIKRTGESGRGLAIAGVILGYAGIVFGTLLFILVIAGAFVSATSDYSTSF